MRRRSVAINSFLVAFIFMAVLSVFSPASADTPIVPELRGVFVVDNHFHLMDDGDVLYGKGVTHIFIYNLAGKININYTYSNGTVIFSSEVFSGASKVLQVVPEAVLVVSQGTVVFYSGVFHAPTWENIAKYRLGSDADTPELARINGFFGFAIAVAIGVFFVWKLIVPMFIERVKVEI